MRRIFFCLWILIFTNSGLSAQNGVIGGRVYDELTNEPIPFANVALQNTDYGAVTDMDGRYTIENLTPGSYTIQASYVGYELKTIFEVEVVNQRPANVNIPMKQRSTRLETVEIRSEAFSRNIDSPVSLQEIGADEIRRNPGGNRDISLAIQSLPGVSSSLAFRNDIIIRGGAPNENRFYLDGIEVPNINHFATQGSSGGPVGIINVDFINAVDFYSGAFPADRGNALSSVLEFRQKDGNEERMRTTFTLGSSDVGLTFDGPLSDKTTYIFSARRSYLQLLFGVLGLPFLPTYNDAQFKIKHRFDAKNELTVLGLGAYDTSVLNPDALSGADTEEERLQAEYILGNLPENTQWNYSAGANYKHYSQNGFQNIVISRNELSNKATKYAGNDDSSPDNLILKYASTEVENKFRFEHTQRMGGLKFNGGVNLEDVVYTNSTRNQIAVEDSVQTVAFQSELRFQKFGIFVQAGTRVWKDRLSLSLGLRTDWTNYSLDMSDPVDQISPRFSLSYSILPELSFNANVGRYYQLPPYTAMGYRDGAGALVNKINGLKYIRADHFVAGFAYIFKQNTKISVEGFYKKYAQYPFSLRDSINLANLGADYGVIGSEPVVSLGAGRSYGVEFLVQRKMYNGLYGIAALTFVRSEFTDKNDAYIPSSWDNRFILSLTAGKKFDKNWEVGTRLSVLGGSPYTPYDIYNSSFRQVWDVRGSGLPDYDRLNSERNPITYQLDVRVDKKYFFDHWNLDLYLDIRNLTNAKFDLQPYLDTAKGPDGNPITNPDNPARYEMTFIPNTAGTLLPSIGIVIGF